MDDAMDETDANYEQEFDMPFANHLGNDVISNGSSSQSNSAVVAESVTQSENNHLVPNAPSGLDFDNLVASYIGHALTMRLYHIFHRCPAVKKEVLIVLLSHISQNTANVKLYMSLYNDNAHLLTSSTLALNTESSSCDVDCSKVFKSPSEEWAEMNLAANSSRLEKLRAEYKKQQDDGIKESTRRALEELVQHMISMGNLQDALRVIGSGIREYCTSAKQIVQMMFTWIEIAVYMMDWSRVENLLSQIKRIIETTEAKSGQNAHRTAQSLPHSANTSTPNIMKAFFASSNAKYLSICALHSLMKKDYLRCAEKCLQIQLDNFCYPELLSAKDIAYYGTFSSLATYSRTMLKENVLGSLSFRKFLESEPKLVDLLQKFYKCDYGSFFDILSEVQGLLFLDVFISSCTLDLCRIIRQRAIVQYFQPYKTANIVKMAFVFRTDVSKMMEELVELIEKNVLKARIDVINRVLVAREPTGSTFHKIMRASKIMEHMLRNVHFHSKVRSMRILSRQSQSSQISCCSSSEQKPSDLSTFPPLKLNMRKSDGSSSMQLFSQNIEADSLNEDELGNLMETGDSTEAMCSATSSQCSTDNVDLDRNTTAKINKSDS